MRVNVILFELRPKSVIKILSYNISEALIRWVCVLNTLVTTQDKAKHYDSQTLNNWGKKYQQKNK